MAYPEGAPGFAYDPTGAFSSLVPLRALPNRRPPPPPLLGMTSDLSPSRAAPASACRREGLQKLDSLNGPAIHVWQVTRKLPARVGQLQRGF